MSGTAKKREKLLRQIEICSYFIRGSLNDYCAKCNRATCVCKTKTQKRSYRITFKDEMQKTRVVYVPRTKVAEIKLMLKNNSKIKAILDELLQLNIEKFKDSG